MNIRTRWILAGVAMAAVAVLAGAVAAGLHRYPSLPDGISPAETDGRAGIPEPVGSGSPHAAG